MTDAKKLMRNKEKGMIGGVCAGLADFFGLDPTIVRVAYVLISILTAFAGILVYVILWIVIPARTESPPPMAVVAPQQR